MTDSTPPDTESDSVESGRCGIRRRCGIRHCGIGHRRPGLPNARDLAEVRTVEVIATLAVHLMTAAAVQLGLGGPSHRPPRRDLDEARKLITALAGLVTTAAPEIGSQHSAPLRDGLRTLQLAFREASVVQDPPDSAPGRS